MAQRKKAAKKAAKKTSAKKSTKPPMVDPVQERFRSGGFGATSAQQPPSRKPSEG